VTIKKYVPGHAYELSSLPNRKGGGTYSSSNLFTEVGSSATGGLLLLDRLEQGAF
jgi:hypothetical protein